MRTEFNKNTQHLVDVCYYIAYYKYLCDWEVQIRTKDLIKI